jgi:hypothetical protein
LYRVARIQLRKKAALAVLISQFTQGRALPNISTDQTASARSTPLAFMPRGLRRGAAAAYLGISPSHFDKQRGEGAIPPPKPLFGVMLYDRLDLDALFDGVPAANDNGDYWEKACGNGSQNT